MCNGYIMFAENQLELGVFNYSQQAFQKHLTKTFKTLK